VAGLITILIVQITSFTLQQKSKLDIQSSGAELV